MADSPCHVSTAGADVSGIRIGWERERGVCTFEGLPVAMMWVDTTLAGLMAGVQGMVGTERFLLALQAEGRRSVEADWQVISQFADFREGFKAIANIAAVAGWGGWVLESLDEARRECRFRVTDSWEGRYQKSLGVCWGSGMLAGKIAGYCSKLFGTNCWADQTAFIARGDAADEFVVRPSPKLIETEIENLLRSDEATRADMAVALRKLEAEVARRTRAEAVLRDSEGRIRAVTDNLKGGMVYQVRRPAEGGRQFTYLSDAVVSLYGCTAQEAMADPNRVYGRIHPDDVGRLVEEEEAAFRAMSVFRTEARVISPDGGVRWSSFVSNPRRMDDGSTVWDGFELDITERKRAESEREKLIAELEARNAELERFTYTVSHDLRSPLITIRGFLECIEESARSGDADRLGSDLGRITAATDRMERLLRELLDLSRIGRVANPPEPVPLEEIAREAAEQVGGRLASGEISLTIAPGLPSVRGDRQRLLELMQNLIENAAKFMGGQPRPRIEVGMRPDDERKTLVFFVRDNGMGIEREHRERIFGLFDKLDPHAEGTGIGLALVRRIVEVHGGSVWAESEGRGKGSTFCFTLAPCAEPGEATDGR